eukprot:MONOS_16590.1-p1 / transcript=MONOS_16590.1 / gene=MONOS_16590 / organism=Monocercomonoides_exilis_PA203 / gene_product=unspecified product / transcript_product=unspecified product / location=Mono_scaffold01892:38-1835(-) / protein_length=562 / sequence_SO=supercontig / SO=protein_coding / is_pseudo=false
MSTNHDFSSNISSDFTSPKLTQSSPYDCPSEKKEEIDTQTPDETYIAREEVCKKMMKLMQHFLSPTKQKTPQSHHSSFTYSTPLRERTTFSAILTPHKPTKILQPTLDCFSSSVEKEKVKCENEKEEKINENNDDKSDSDNGSSEEDADFLESSSDSEEKGLEEDEIDFEKEKSERLKLEKYNETICQIPSSSTDNTEHSSCQKIKSISSSNFSSSISTSAPSSSSSASASASASSSFSSSSSSSSSFNNQPLLLSPSHEFPTKMDAALKRVGKEKAKEYLKIKTMWSEATAKKHAWVERLLMKYAEEVEVKPWPLTPDLARAFVLFCGKECMYPLSSIGYIIVPSLKRINIEKRGKRLNRKTHLAMREAIRYLRFSRNVEKNVMIKEPALIKDVTRIVEFIPSSLESKEMEASLYLVAVHTGARAITLANVHLSDITRVIKSEKTKKFLCTLRYNRTKGSANWRHEVTIEGLEEEESGDDPVYWLSAYLRKRCGITLSEWMDKRSEANLEELLWPISTDSMRERFKTRAANAGYPRSLFCFHSLRSGFICSALIKCGAKEI